MNIVIASTLFPPDIAEPASYVKELARRLREQGAITLVIYGRLPEKISGVSIRCVNKRRPLLWRLTHYTLALVRAAAYADIVYAENGSAVELPALIACTVTRTPLILHVGDRRAHEYAMRTPLRGLLERAVRAAAHVVIEENPLPRPEIMPFEAYPNEAMAAYESSWTTHIAKLKNELGQLAA